MAKLLNSIKQFFCFHAWEPQPQGPVDFIWSFRTWKCIRCGKKQLRRTEGKQDNPREVLDRMFGKH